MKSIFLRECFLSLSLILLYTDIAKHTEKDNFLKLLSVKISEIRGVRV